MRCRLGVGEGAVGKVQSLIDSPEHPQRDGIICFRCGAGIYTEPVHEIGMARRVVEFEGLPKLLMGGAKVVKIKAGGAEHAVGDQGFGAIGAGCGLAQEQLDDFAHRRGFAAIKVPREETVISRETLRNVFFPARQFACACSLAVWPSAAIARAQ
jgi:hypothetical protein